MIEADASADIARPVDPVYQFVVADFFLNYPRWSPEVLELEPLGSTELVLGTRGRQVRVDRGRRSETTFRVTRLEPGHGVRFEGEGGARFAICYGFEPLGEDASRLTLRFELKRVDLFMRPFEKLIRLAIRDGTRRTVRNIKGLVERECQSA